MALSESPIPSGCTRDALLGGRIAVTQFAGGLRAGSDAVFLAAAVPARPGERALEAGCGSGAGFLCLAARVAQVRLVGLEVQPDLAELARRNAMANGFADRVQVWTGDLHRPPPELEPASFDHVFANPPYFAAGQHDRSPDAGRALARSEESAGDLARWLAFMLGMAKPGGSITLIQRAERLGDVLGGLGPAAGDVRLCPLWPGNAKPAKRLIVQARKGSRAPLKMLPGLVLHEAAGAYTAAAEAILRHAGPLDL